MGLLRLGLYTGWLLMMVVLVSLETTLTIKVALGMRGVERKGKRKGKGRKGKEIYSDTVRFS